MNFDFSYLENLSLEKRVREINKIRLSLSAYSPFSEEPIDCVQWVHTDGVNANDYNPNSVAPPEMELLRHSINNDGYTQPVVTWETGEDEREVIDGFHRTRVCKEFDDVRNRVHGYLPVVSIKPDCEGRNNRIASTIRHNRARGKHNVDAMSDIEIELKRRNWATSRICRELGMDEDEVLRLCQITGLQEMFSDEDFSQSWDAVGEIEDVDFSEDDIDIENDDFQKNPNTSDEKRVFHTFDKWECHKAGFYKNSKDGLKKQEGEELYRDFFLSGKFKDSLERVTSEWKNSCEHYLSNSSMNRIAWLGQAAACISEGLPSCYRSGWFLLNEDDQDKNNKIAYKHLCDWLKINNYEEVSFEDAYSGRQSDIY